ncbi:MAG: hypothetical protein NZL93_02070, partial [Chthoniobacterales bacterium]|nr:hypothetical protein [Chthoniobacterales bacterium]
MERLIYWIALVLVKVLQILPARVCDQVGQAVGLLAWCIMPGYRGLVCRNMEVAYGEHKTRKEINKLCLEHFRALGANLAGAAHFFGAKEQEIRSHTQLEGINFLLEAHRKGRGVVLAISHIGNWEMFAQACFYVPQVRFGTIYQRIHNRYLDNWLTRIRQKRGVRTFERRSGLNEAVKFLKSGGVLGVLVDQHAGDSGLWTPFFGKLASTSPLAAVLATRTGASVVPVAVFRSGCAFWRICVWPEIPANCSVEELTARINRVLEEQILVSPRDWFWVHNRWKLPRPHFLLANVKRGIYYSPSKNFEKLQKLRILIRTSNWLGDAVMNVPAVRAIRMGRPDLHITILSPEKLVEFWKEIQAGDEVLGIPQSWGA